MPSVPPLVTGTLRPDHRIGPALLAFAVVGGLLWVLARGWLSRLCALGAAASLAVAGEVTLGRPGSALDAGHLSFLRSCQVTDPWQWSTEGLLNVLLLAPFCFLAVLAVGHPVLVGLAGVGVSMTIEVLQATTNRGVCDSSDVVHNAIGAVAAAALAGALRRWWRWARSPVLAPSQAWPSSC